MFGKTTGEPMSGPLLMLKSLGLGPVLEAANGLAQSGAIEKLVAFADRLEQLDLEGMNERLERIERAVAGRAAEPGSDAGHGGPVGGPAEPLRLSGGDGAPGAGSDIDASGDADHRRRRSKSASAGAGE